MDQAGDAGALARAAQLLHPCPGLQALPRPLSSHRPLCHGGRPKTSAKLSGGLRPGNLQPCLEERRLAVQRAALPSTPPSLALAQEAAEPAGRVPGVSQQRHHQVPAGKSSLPLHQDPPFEQEAQHQQLCSGPGNQSPEGVRASLAECVRRAAGEPERSHPSSASVVPRLERPCRG